MPSPALASFPLSLGQCAELRPRSCVQSPDICAETASVSGSSPEPFQSTTSAICFLPMSHSLYNYKSSQSYSHQLDQQAEAQGGFLASLQLFIYESHAAPSPSTKECEPGTNATNHDSRVPFSPRAIGAANSLKTLKCLQ